MRVRVLFFSVLQDLAGGNETEEFLDPSRPWTVSDLLERLYEEYEGLSNWDGQILVAVDQAYVERDAILSDGQEVAIMPPVQGG